MSAMDWIKHEGRMLWHKTCSNPSCKTEFWVEADDFAGARELMLEHFTPYGSHWSSTALDGLFSSCRSCDGNKTHKRQANGIHRDDMLLSQNGKCAIKACKREISFKNRTAFVDHDHATRKIRAILCNRCNMWMAGIDNDKWLAAAMAYRKAYR